MLLLSIEMPLRLPKPLTHRVQGEFLWPAVVRRMIAHHALGELLGEAAIRAAAPRFRSWRYILEGIDGLG